MQTEQNF